MTIGLSSNQYDVFMKNIRKITNPIACLWLSGCLCVNSSTEDIMASDDSRILLNALLDGLHRDAHEGNFQTYFARYSSNAVFLLSLIHI
mgnify:CR=1 FL=1